jgi:hypothetical protein
VLPRASEQVAAAGRNQTARVRRLPAMLRRKRKRPAPSHQLGLQQSRVSAQTCSHQYDCGMPCRKVPDIVDLQQRKNTARISWSHKIQRLWQFNHRYVLANLEIYLGRCSHDPRRLCCFERTLFDAIIPRCGRLILEPGQEAASGHAMSAPGQPGNAIDVDAWGQ